MTGDKNKKQLTAYAKYSGIGLQMLLIIGLGTFACVKLDEKFPNKHNLYTVFLSLASVLVAIFYVVKRILALTKEDKDEE